MSQFDSEIKHWPPIMRQDVCCEKKEVVLVTENLQLQYPGKIAFTGVNATFHKGCITALVGPSGCGKTSFLMCLNRLIEMVPGAQVSGRLIFDGQDIHSPDVSLASLRRRIGMIFQKPNPFPISIRNNMTLALREHRMGTPQEREDIMEQALKDVGLWNEVKDRLNSSALALSGGQQQRLCIARALVLKPEVLLMDEPCSALDPLSSAVVEDLITELRGQYTVVIVTHNLAQARRIADDVGFFWVHEGAGRLIEFGSSQQIFEAPAHELTAAYIAGVRG